MINFLTFMAHEIGCRIGVHTWGSWQRSTDWPGYHRRKCVVCGRKEFKKDPRP